MFKKPRIRAAQEAGKLEKQHPPITTRKMEVLFRIGGAGAFQSSRCNRSSSAEITGNSKLIVHRTPQSPDRPADLPAEERHSQWMNIHSDSSAPP